MKNKWKCICTGEEEFGDYTNMVVFKFDGKRYQVDVCLEDEIKYLLSQGVKTVASCCGHKKTEGFITVEKDSVTIMKQLGYERHINPHYPDAEEFFKPKTK